MQSYSKSHHHPDRSDPAPDRHINADVVPGRCLALNEVRVWAHQKPALTSGNYHLSVGQSLVLPSNSDDDDDDGSNHIPNTLQVLQVKTPRFSLNDHGDVYSVHPARGHSAPARTLAHVVFSHPTVPWEQEVFTASNLSLGPNALPWLGVVSFTEDELLLSDKSFQDLGFDFSAGDKEEGLGAVETTTDRLKKLCPTIVCSLPPESQEIDSGVANPPILVLNLDTFQKVFSHYDDQGRREWRGQPDVSTFALLAHVLETHGGFSANTHAAMGDHPSQPRFSVAVSSRTGPPGLSSPKRVISHLISLVGVPDLDLSSPATRYVGLVSLHAWDWTATPEEAVDFERVMSSLGERVRPLALDYRKMSAARAREGQPEASDDAAHWLMVKMEAGFVLKPHTLMLGEQEFSLMRGPLVPFPPTDSVAPINTSSLYGEDLEYFDKDTGAPVQSYKVAWSLGRAMMMADRTVTSSLLRLRGKVHAEVVKRLKSRALHQDGHDMLVNSPKDLQGPIDKVLSHLERSHATGSVQGKANSASRWTRSDVYNARLPARLLSPVSTAYTLTEYLDELDTVMSEFFGMASRNGNAEQSEARTTDADAAAIRAWALDRLMLAGIPLHNLVLEPEMLPSESIRTFYIDHRWIDTLVDGGLSVANHHARDDDALRRVMKDRINQYLANPRPEGPCQGVVPQLPRWGFFLRSSVVSACPDLKVICPLIGMPAALKEHVYMQRLAPDILVCLFDRCPGKGVLETVVIAQPHHQQGFEFGTRLDDREIRVCYRGVPLQYGQPSQESRDEVIPAPATDVYDYNTRRFHPRGYMKRFFQYLQPSISYLDTGSNGGVDGLSSGHLATQLWSKNLRLELSVRDEVSAEKEVVLQSPLQFSNSIRPDQNPALVRPTKTISQPSRSRLAPPIQVPLPKSPLKALPIRQSTPFGDPSLELELDSILPSSIWPAEPSLWARCSVARNPGEDSNSIYLTPGLNDILFHLEMNGETAVPRTLEVHIPVVFSSIDYPGDPMRRPLLTLEGLPSTAHVPVIEDVSNDRLWTIKGRFGHIRPLDESTASPAGTVGVTGSAVLILRITPRFPALPSLVTRLNLSFILRKVHITSPEKGFSESSFDVICSSKDGLWTRHTRTVKVHRAVAAAISSVSRQIFQDNHIISLTLSHEPPAGALFRLKAATPRKDFAFTVSAREMSVISSTGQVLVHVEANLHQCGEVYLTATAMNASGTQALGPESEPFHVPVRVDDIQVFMCRRDDKLLVSWSPLQKGQVPFQVRINFYAAPPQQIVWIGGSEGKYELTPLPGATTNVVIATWRTIDVNFPFEGSRTVSHTMLPATPPSLRLTNNLGFFSPPRPGDQLVSASYLPGTKFPDTYSRKTELWYLESASTVRRVIVDRERGQLDVSFDVPSVSPPLPWNTGALTWCYFQRYYSGERTEFKPGYGLGQNTRRHGCCMLLWIGVDGSVNASYQTDGDIESFYVIHNWSSWSKPWKTVQVAPQKSASTTNGGCIHASAQGDFIADWCFSQEQAVVWWIGSTGELCGRRFSMEVDENSTMDPRLVVSELAPPSKAGVGAMPITASRLEDSNKLPRSMQMATISISPHLWAVFYFNTKGDLMCTTAPPNEFPQESLVSPKASCSGLASLQSHVRMYQSRVRDVSVAWMGDNGAIYQAFQRVIVEEGKEINLVGKWTVEALTPPGAAHPATEVCFIGGATEHVFGIVFLGQDGHFNVITRAWGSSDLPVDMSWSILPTKGHLESLKGASRIRLACTGPARGKGISEVFFSTGGTAFGQLAIDLSKLVLAHDWTPRSG